jgi:hypothetical protein
MAVSRSPRQATTRTSLPEVCRRPVCRRQREQHGPRPLLPWELHAAGIRASGTKRRPATVTAPARPRHTPTDGLLSDPAGSLSARSPRGRRLRLLLVTLPPCPKSHPSPVRNQKRSDCKIKGVTHAPSALCPLRTARMVCDGKAPCCGVFGFGSARGLESESAIAGFSFSPGLGRRSSPTTEELILPRI